LCAVKQNEMELDVVYVFLMAVICPDYANFGELLKMNIFYQQTSENNEKQCNISRPQAAVQTVTLMSVTACPS